MSRSRALALALLMLSLACSIPVNPPAGNLETQVAGTLTSLAPPADVQQAASPTPLPATSTPPPTASPQLDSPSLVEWKVAYTDAGHPWIITESDDPLQLSPLDGVYEVLLSSDGEVVVFLRRPDDERGSQPTEVYAVNSDGSQQRLLMSGEDFNALYPHEGFLHNDLASIEFVPGSHELLLNTRVVAEGPGLIKYDDLLRLSADSGDRITILPPGQGGDFTVAPDGSRVALVRPDSVHLVNPDGSGLAVELVSFEPLITYSEFQFYVNPLWSADSSQLAVVIPSADVLAEDPEANIWSISADGTQVDLLATVSGDFYFSERTGRSSLSPDFARVVYRLPEPGGRTLMIADLGQQGVAYDDDVLEWWGWSPQGDYFTYAKGEPTNGLRGAPGVAPSPLHSGGRPNWISPESYYFLQGSIGNWTLLRRDLGVAPQEILSPAGDFVRFDFVHP